MIRRGVPIASPTHDIIETFDRYATPLAVGRQSGATRTSKLKEQGLWPTVLRPNHVGAHFADMAFIRGNYLMFVEDRLPDKRVGGRIWHRLPICPYGRINSCQRAPSYTLPSATHLLCSLGVAVVWFSVVPRVAESTARPVQMRPLVGCAISRRWRWQPLSFEER